MSKLSINEMRLLVNLRNIYGYQSMSRQLENQFATPPTPILAPKPRSASRLPLLCPHQLT